MRNPPRFPVVALLAAALVPTARADDPEDPAARALLDEVAATYRGLDHYADDGTFTIAVSIDGTPQERTWPLRLTFERPGKIAIQAGDVGLIGDGKTLTLVNGPTKRYLVLPSPGAVTLDTIAEGSPGAMLLGGAGGQPAMILATLLLGDDPRRSILGDGAELKLVGDREIEGKTYRVLSLLPLGGPSYLLAIDPETKLIQRIDLEADDEALRSRVPEGAPALSDARIGWSAGTISSEPPKPESFAFQPPEDFTRVADIQGPAAREEPRHPLIGEPAPEFTLTVLDGEAGTKRIRKDDLAGKVVMLDFWATWCGPCLAELPEVQKMVESFAQDGKPVVIVAVSQDREPRDGSPVRALVERTLDEKTLDLSRGDVGKVALDPEQAVGDVFRVQAYPTVVILDPKGIVQSVHVGYDEDVRAVLTGEIDTLLEGRSLIEPAGEGQGKVEAAPRRDD